MILKMSAGEYIGGFTVLSMKALSMLLTMEWIEMFTKWITYPMILVSLTDITHAGCRINEARIVVCVDKKSRGVWVGGMDQLGHIRFYQV